MKTTSVRLRKYLQTVYLMKDLNPDDTGEVSKRTNIQLKNGQKI